jgi:hypothetical protein
MRSTEWDIIEVVEVNAPGSIVAKSEEDQAPKRPPLTRRAGALATSLGAITLTLLSPAAGALQVPIVETSAYASTVTKYVVPLDQLAAKPQSRASGYARGTDTQVGMSTNKLAAVGRALFRPADDEAEYDTDYKFF